MGMIANAALAAGMARTRFGPWRRLLGAAANPEAAQRDALKRILTANAATDFGRDHRFAAIDGADAFRQAVPVQDYERLRPYVKRQEGTDAPALTALPPVFYQRTSGTVGPPKDIPLTEAGIARIRNFQSVAAYAQYSGSGAFRGRILGIGSSAIEGYTTNGKPYGSASGLIYESQPTVIRSKFVLPPEVFAITDYRTRYYVIAALAMAASDVTGVATANPSTLVKLLDVINDEAEQLLSDLNAGRLSIEDSVAPEQRSAIAASFSSVPRRSRELTRLYERQDVLTYADLWPGLAAIVTWTGGSCGVPLANLQGRYPAKTKLIEAGYVASEFRGTLNVDVARNACLPTLNDHFFEFVPRDAWEAGSDDFLGLQELSEGEFYYVFVTTPDGLYRYDINDIVTVNGRISATPTLAFVQKGKGVTNITGEKLYENQLIQAIESACGDRALSPVFFVTLADEERAQYVTYLEATGGHVSADALNEAVDAQLRAFNLEYDAKRSSLRLEPPQVHRLAAGTADAYRRHCVSNGQRDAQFKVLHLQYAKDCSFDFAAHVAHTVSP